MLGLDPEGHSEGMVAAKNVGTDIPAAVKHSSYFTLKVVLSGPNTALSLSVAEAFDRNLETMGTK